MKAKPKQTGRWILAGLSVVVGLLVGLTLRGLRGDSERATVEPTTGSSRSTPALPSSAAAPAGLAPRPDEIPPWQATPQNTTALPPGTVPAWQVNPPPPDPSLPLPPPPREPANPALHRPPMDNPGGVNSDRPERAAD